MQDSSFKYYYPSDEKLLAQYIFYSWKAQLNISFKEKDKRVRLIDNYIYLLKPEETVNLIDEIEDFLNQERYLREINKVQSALFVPSSTPRRFLDKLLKLIQDIAMQDYKKENREFRNSNSEDNLNFLKRKFGLKEI